MAKIWSGGASEDVGEDISDIMTVEDVRIDSMLLDYEVVTLIAYQIQLRNESIISKEDSDSILSGLLDLKGIFGGSYRHYQHFPLFSPLQTRGHLQ